MGQKGKLKFHEFLAKRISSDQVGIDGDLRNPQAIGLLTALNFARECSMPAAAARKIAADNRGLSEQLRKVGQELLANVAAEVLADLAAREDEPKQEAAAIAP